MVMANHLYKGFCLSSIVRWSGVSMEIANYVRFELTQFEKESGEIQKIPVDKIIPDPDQPRKKFDEEKLNELAESIKQHGLLEPILVKPIEDEKYQIITGERRWRACKIAGQTTIKAIVWKKEISGAEKLELQLIENLHREDLDPVEEAETYKRLIKECGYTQEELAKRLGKSREYVSNKLRLLKSPDFVKEKLKKGVLSEGHARAILSLKPDDQEKAVEVIIKNNLSVREAEEIARNLKEGGVSRETPTSDISKDDLIIGVWVSEKTYNHLDKLAKSQKMTIEKLCSKILEKEASKSE